MEKVIFSNKIFRKTVALILSMVVLAAVIPAVSVTSFAEDYTYNVALNQGVQILNRGVQMGSSGTIPSNATFLVGGGLGNEIRISGLDRYSTSVETANGRLYTLTSAVDFRISGDTITFTKHTVVTEKEVVSVADVINDLPQPPAIDPFFLQKMRELADFHDHANNSNDTFVWEETTPATAYSDGERTLRCPDCGYVERTEGSPAGDVFFTLLLAMIKASKPGQVINIEARQWNSFPKEVMDALIERSNAGVTFNISFINKEDSGRTLYDMTIPPGSELEIYIADGFTGLLSFASEINSKYTINIIKNMRKLGD